MAEGEKRTTWKMGECVISYERNITSLTLVEFAHTKPDAAAMEDACGTPEAALPLASIGNTSRKTVKAFIRL